MFDISWHEILVVGAVALIVVGPKELPTLLRTIGKYVGLVKRQAAEFRAQFDEAMRESDLAQLKKDVESIKSEAEGTFRDVQSSVDREITGVRDELDNVAKGIDGAPTDPSAYHDANGLPLEVVDPTPPALTTSPSGAGAAAIAAAAAAAPPEATPPEANRAPAPNATPASPSAKADA